MNIIYHQMRLSKILFSFLSFLFLTSCYSFTGNSLTPEMKTIQIKTFPNNAALVNPELSQQFTIALQNRFLQRTTLKGATQNPDLMIEGKIVDYRLNEPTTISTGVSTQGGVMQAAQNKLVISVKVRYENKIDPQLSFDRTYTDEAVYNSDLDITQIENSQVQIVNERIINKIFNDIVANW
ncbi:hypothetical protein D1J36_006060 [Riemerella anatipestifer]|uniref:LPS assembly lipoprotein LptE n=1 Tax=Riemerella anatipestifer TaxID=34085 RepID=UPI0012AE5F5F|nr:LPS assembly lipoprotein LptE [Riemerella anatipestifer]USL94864.1 hypothetical protein D1J36_006060 [Riemerella anatipestifer]